MSVTTSAGGVTARIETMTKMNLETHISRVGFVSTGRRELSSFSNVETLDSNSINLRLSSSVSSGGIDMGGVSELLGVVMFCSEVKSSNLCRILLPK